MATYIKTIQDPDGNTILPRTRTDAITMDDGVTTIDDVTDGLAGGTTGQMLVKSSDTDYDYAWGSTSGTGDVIGPSGAVAGNFAALDASGKILSDSLVSPASFSPIDHNHTGIYAPALGEDDNYVTDAEKTALHGHSNLTALNAVSGTNTGDQDLSGLVPTSRTVQGKALSSNVTIAATATPQLTVVGWSANSQSVAVSGVTTNNIVIVSPVAASYDAYVAAGIRCTVQAENSLTFACDTTPEVAIDVGVVII